MNRNKILNNCTSILKVMMTFFVVITGVFLTGCKKKEVITFTEPSRTGVRTINFYTLKGNSTDILDYADKTFILQSEMNLQDEEDAMKSLAEECNIDPLSLYSINCSTIQEAIDTFYSETNTVLVLNEAIVEQLNNFESYKDFSDKTELIYTIQLGKEISVVNPNEQVEENNSFVLYIAGNDTRNDGLTLNGRTDTDMIMAVNPKYKQILLVSIPRDFYVKNPALGNELDKLTHLGNNGIENTLDGINQEFDLEIKSYITTNFTHFKSLIDQIGGIDIHNPYSFSAFGEKSFPEGDLHLNGEQALSYSRERKSLSNGDYGRNEHQGIVMQGILTKIQQLTNQGDYVEVVKMLSDNFLTNINFNSIYKNLNAADDSLDWEFIRYHLGGEGTYDGTVSMGFDRKLYVCKPFESQVQFVNEQVNKVLEGEKITLEDLPDNEKTTFVEN